MLYISKFCFGLCGCPNFFFYTDGGILWVSSPIGFSSDIWSTGDYLLVGRDSHLLGDVYEVYKSGSDGNRGILYAPI